MSLKENLSINTKLLCEAYKSVDNRRSGQYLTDYLHLDDLSELVAKTLFLNNYEVDLILQSFLRLWIRDPEKPGIPCFIFVQYFKPTFEGLIRMFFEERIVDHNLYFVFVCIYVFFGKNRILQLLISQAKIHSNKLVTYSQINYFLNKFNFSGDIIHLVFLLITPIHDNHSVYKLNEFMNVIKSLNDYRIMVDGLKETLIAEVFSERIYENIAMKVTYNYSINNPSYEVLDDSDKDGGSKSYEEKDEENDDLDIYGMEDRIMKEKGKEKRKEKVNEKDKKRKLICPKESCMSKFVRIVFTNNPPPFTYDYYLISPDKYSFDNIIYDLKHKNGYGQRNGDSSCRSLSFKHIMSGRKESGKLSNRSLKKCQSTLNNPKNAASHLLVNVSNNYSSLTGENISSVSKTNVMNPQPIVSHSILQPSISNPSSKTVDRISISVIAKPNPSSTKLGYDKTTF